MEFSSQEIYQFWSLSNVYRECLLAEMIFRLDDKVEDCRRKRQMKLFQSSSRSRSFCFVRNVRRHRFQLGATQKRNLNFQLFWSIWKQTIMFSQTMYLQRQRSIYYLRKCCDKLSKAHKSTPLIRIIQLFRSIKRCSTLRPLAWLTWSL